MCLPMFASTIHLWVTICGISFPVTSALLACMFQGPCSHTSGMCHGPVGQPGYIVHGGASLRVFHITDSCLVADK
jgi:hypothetical protein